MTLRRARVLAGLHLVRAWPLPPTKRDDSRSSVPSSIYTPAVVIFVVFVGLAAIGCFGRALLRRSRAAQIANASAARPAGQLTSTLNAGSASTTTANPTGAPRRTRRPRRTPSQVSVTSLPEYMKEPGEHELVIGQGPARTHTLTMPVSYHEPAATIVVDPSDDDDARTPATGTSRYSPIPTSANTMPLLQDRNSNDNNDANEDISLHDLSQQRQRAGSTSTDTTRSESANVHTTDTLSPASISTFPLAPPPPPAYFEVVADDDVPLSTQYYPPHLSSSRLSVLSSSTSTVSTSYAPLLGSRERSTSTSMSPEAAWAGTSRARNRQSGFRTFLNRMSMSIPSGSGPSSNPAGAGHQRSESSNSITSTTSFFRRPGSSLSSISLAINPNQSHHTRQNPSISQSRASLLSSPSTVSINSLSISAPLTHTASRTHFTFPQPKSSTTMTTTKAGAGATATMMMTPEQIKVIAAREAIGRFGVPYGPDAVAFAAAREYVVGVDPPPPGFEEVVGEAGEGSGSRLDVGDEVVEEPGGGGHGARGEASASTSSTATVRVASTPGPGPSGIKVVQDGAEGTNSPTRARSSSRNSLLELVKPADPSTSSASNGMNAPPPSSTSPPTPTQTMQGVSTSEFGALSSASAFSSKLLSPNAIRSGSLSSNCSTQTFATAHEVPLTTSSSSNCTSRSSSCSVVVGGGGGDVVKGWSSSEEGDEDGGGQGVDELGSVTPRIARLGLDRGMSEVEV